MPTAPPKGRGKAPIIAAVAAVVVIAGVVIGIVASGGGGGSHSTTTIQSSSNTTVSPASSATTAAPDTSETTTSPTTSSSSSGGGSLLSNSPFSSCTDLPTAERGVPEATDEVVCTGSDVSSDGGNVAYYAQFSSSSVAAAYISALSRNAASSGDCSSVTASDVTALCTFQDEDSLGGNGLLYVGEEFVFGPNESNTETDCGLINQPTNQGTTVMVFQYSGSNVIGGILSCSASQTAMASMKTGLLDGDFELNNQ